MAFPFSDHKHEMRRRILIAIGSSGLAGLGCGSPSAQGGGALEGDPGRDGSMMDPTGMQMPMQQDASMMKPTDDPTSMRPPDMTHVSCEFGSGVSETRCLTRESMENTAAGDCGQIPVEPAPTADEVAAKFLDNGCLAAQAACDGCCNPAATEGVPMGDGSCCYEYCTGSCCGRPLVIGGVPRVASVTPRSDWGDVLDAGRPPSLGDAVQRRIADAWLMDARMEHASIASFARFGLELLSFGAPAELVELCQRAALDEVAHARACFAMAERYHGSPRGPAPLDVSGATAASTLRESVRAALAEGCVGETRAAGLAAHALRDVRDTAAKATLERIARDEAQHAQLAWRFVAWALRSDPSLRLEVRTLLEGIVTAGATACVETETAETLATLHAAGRLSAAEQDSASAAILHDVVVPCATALLEGVSATAAASATESAIDHA